MDDTERERLKAQAKEYYRLAQLELQKGIRIRQEVIDDFYQLQSDEETEYCANCGEPMDVCTCQHSQPEELVMVKPTPIGFDVYLPTCTVSLSKEALSQLAYKAEAALQDSEQ
jgi:hypothetical protein